MEGVTEPAAGVREHGDMRGRHGKVVLANVTNMETSQRK